MTFLVAALPMYDWPERRDEVDAEWAAIRDRLRAAGVDAPESLVRRNGDLPRLPAGGRGQDGAPAAPDAADLSPDGLDLQALWRHPKLLFGQTCWGPMELGLSDHLRVIGQPDYSGLEGGRGPLYSSAIVMRRGEAPAAEAPADGTALLPAGVLRGKRLAFNSPDSMSGLLSLTRDLAAAGHDLSIFPERIETGGHRASLKAVADGTADVAAVDCRSWQLALRFEPAARDLAVVGWTGLRKGLPYVTSRSSQNVDWPSMLPLAG
jgi:ABC-type phosphate/phosphonate transport system substrate-binding protein